MKAIKRRQFLAATAATMAFPYVGRVLGANNKLNIGVVGVSGRGAGNLNGVSGENIVALCDVSAGNLAGASVKHPKAKTYSDFRQMLEQKDLSEENLYNLVLKIFKDKQRLLSIRNNMKKNININVNKNINNLIEEFL